VVSTVIVGWGPEEEKNLRVGLERHGFPSNFNPRSTNFSLPPDFNMIDPERLEPEE
jgi:hypothetical protein